MSAPAGKKRDKARPRAEPAERPVPAAVSSPVRTLPYALALFLGSTLLFLLEPIAAKRLLPLLGGSAAVWTACLVFFQTALLLGYYLAHLLVTRTNRRAQVSAYVGLLALSVVQLLRAVDPAMRANVDRPIVSVRGCSPPSSACRSSRCRRRVRCCSRGSRARRREDLPTHTDCSRSRTSVRSSRCWRIRG